MEKIPLLKRADKPAPTDAAQQPKSYGSDGSALKTRRLPPSDPTNQPPLSERQVTVREPGPRVMSPLPLPKFLQESPFFGPLLRAVVGRTDDEKSEVTCLVFDILRGHMGVSVDKSIEVVRGLDHSQQESLCGLFCGKAPTVLVTKESRHADFIVLPHCADIALLQHLAKLLGHHSGLVVAARLLCAAMLAVRDTPERAADLLKSYCQLILKTRKQLPPPSFSLDGVIKAVLARAPGCLLADEVYALKRHFELAAANEADPVKAKTFASVADALAAVAVTLAASGDLGQRRDFQSIVTKAIQSDIDGAGDGVSTVPRDAKPLTFDDIDAMIPRPEEAIFLSEADHRMLLEAALLLPPEQSVLLARRLVASQFDGTQRKHLEVLCQALELDALNVPLGNILEVLREELGAAAPSSDLATLLSSALIARLTQRKLDNDECRQLAGIAVTLAVPKPGERLTNALNHFFRQVGEQLLRTGASTHSLDRLFAPLTKGLMLRVMPEALAAMLPEEQHKAQIALGACFAGRALLHPDVASRNRQDSEVGFLQAPPDLSSMGFRVARGYFYLCLQHHFATDVSLGLVSAERADWYLSSAFQDLYTSWPELNSVFGITLEPLSDPMASQLLLALHEASVSSSTVSLREGHPAHGGRARLQAWVRTTMPRRALGF